jgi:hypothetical protein
MHDSRAQPWVLRARRTRCSLDLRQRSRRVGSGLTRIVSRGSAAGGAYVIGASGAWPAFWSIEGKLITAPLTPAFQGIGSGKKRCGGNRSSPGSSLGKRRRSEDRRWAGSEDRSTANRSLQAQLEDIRSPGGRSQSEEINITWIRVVGER